MRAIDLPATKSFRIRNNTPYARRQTPDARCQTQPAEPAIRELSADTSYFSTSLDDFSQDDLAALLDEKLANLDFDFD